MERKMRMTGKPKEVRPVTLMIDDRQVEAFSMSDAAVYMHHTETTLRSILERQKKLKQPIKQYTHNYGRSRARYLLKSDLDRLMAAKPVEEE